MNTPELVLEHGLHPAERKALLIRHAAIDKLLDGVIETIPRMFPEYVMRVQFEFYHRDEDPVTATPAFVDDRLYDIERKVSEVLPGSAAALDESYIFSPHPIIRTPEDNNYAEHIPAA